KPKFSGYPEMQEPFTGEISELQKHKEADSGDLFEHVQFSESRAVKVEPEVKIVESKVSQKAYTVPKGYPERSDPYIGDLENLEKKDDPSRVQISEFVSEVPEISLTSKITLKT